MKTLDEYLSLPYRMEILTDTREGGYIIRFPELPGCLTCGETLERALHNTEDCKRVWMSAALEEKTTIPEPASSK